MSRNKSLNIGDVIWAIYFFIIFNLYTYTYVQLAGQILIVVYTFLDFFKNKKIKKNVIKALFSNFLWYGLFTIWCILSLKWVVYPPKTSTSTLLTIVRIATMSLCLCYYIMKTNNIKKILKIFLYNCLIFALISIVSSPISTWGTTNFSSFNKGYHRNTIASFCLTAVCFLDYLKEDFSKSTYRIYLLLLIATIILCGSRGTIILFAVYEMLKIINEKNINIKFNKVFFSIIAIIGVFLVANSIPYLKTTYIDRLYEILLRDEAKDTSVIGRRAYIKIGFEMFKEKPVKGWGVDGFYNNLYYNSVVLSSGKLHAVYSHNNFVELLSCYGIVGFFIFYMLHIKLLLNTIKYKKNNKTLGLIFTLTLLFIIGDYKTIVFTYHIQVYILTMLFCFLLLEQTKIKEENESSEINDKKIIL